MAAGAANGSLHPGRRAHTVGDFLCAVANRTADRRPLSAKLVRGGSTYFDASICHRASLCLRPFRGLDPEQLIRAFRLMHTSRRLDDREVALKRQNRIFFQISGAGHEAVQVAAGMVLRSGHDWFYPYYRDRALCLALGVTPYEMLQQAAGAASDPASGGRQMPSHWGHAGHHIVSGSSATGTQFSQAAGCAEASLYGNAGSGEVTLVASGEGATSEGEFWEALNAACLKRLPLVFLVEDNGYAISVPVEYQTAGGSVSQLAAGFPALHRQEFDGTDFLASYRAVKTAVEYCRRGQRTGAAARPRDPALFALALRR